MWRTCNHFQPSKITSHRALSPPTFVRRFFRPFNAIVPAKQDDYRFSNSRRHNLTYTGVELTIPICLMAEVRQRRRAQDLASISCSPAANERSLSSELAACWCSTSSAMATISGQKPEWGKGSKTHCSRESTQQNEWKSGGRPTASLAVAESLITFGSFCLSQVQVMPSTRQRILR